MEMVEQVGSRLDQIARLAERQRRPRQPVRQRAEAEIGFARLAAAGVQPDAGARRIMGGEQARGQECLRLVRRGVPALRLARSKRTTQHLFEGRARDATRSQQADIAIKARDNRRFHADPAGTAIDHGRDTPSEIRHDMAGAGRADPARAVGRGCDDRAGDGPQQRLSHRVTGHTQAQRRQAGACDEADTAGRSRRDDERERARPEGASKRQRIAVEVALLAR
jgi:hypothetical protein